LIKVDDIQFSPMGEKAIAVWRDDLFFCAAFDVGGCIRLSFHRHDLTDGITWDEVQEIKRGCGYGDNDALECFPADDAVMNTGNIRHIFIFDKPIPLVWRRDAKL